MIVSWAPATSPLIAHRRRIWVFSSRQEVWGMGYATEAARLLVCVGFEQLGLNRIFSTCDVANAASARVLEKAGLQREATLEQHKYRARSMVDFVPLRGSTRALVPGVAHDAPL